MPHEKVSFLSAEEREDLVYRLAGDFFLKDARVVLVAALGVERAIDLTVENCSSRLQAERVVSFCEERVDARDRSWLDALGTRFGESDIVARWLKRLRKPPAISPQPPPIDEHRHLSCDRKEQWRALCDFIQNEKNARTLFLYGRMWEAQRSFIQRLKHSLGEAPEKKAPEQELSEQKLPPSPLPPCEKWQARFPFIRHLRHSLKKASAQEEPKQEPHPGKLRLCEVSWAAHDHHPPLSTADYLEALAKAVEAPSSSEESIERALAARTKEGGRLIIIHKDEVHIGPGSEEKLEALHHYYTQLLPKLMGLALDSQRPGPLVLQTLVWERNVVSHFLTRWQALAWLRKLDQSRWQALAWLRKLEQSTENLRHYKIERLPEFDRPTQEEVAEFLRDPGGFAPAEAATLARQLLKKRTTHDLLAKLKHTIAERSASAATRSEGP